MHKYDDDILGLSFELSRILRRKMAFHSHAKAEMNMLQAYGLSIIKDAKMTTMTELATLLKISSSTATTFIDRQVKLGWVKRKENAKNRKLVHVLLTAKGEKALARNMQQKKEFMRKVVTLLKPQDREHLLRILKSLLRAINTIDSPTS